MSIPGADDRLPVLPAEIERGLALFNAGHFFEAHEEMERAWLRERGPVRSLYQGLIQLAVAGHHLREGNRNGAIKMADAARDKLAGFIPRPGPLSLGELCDAIESLSETLRRGDPLSGIELPAIRRRHDPRRP